MGYDQSLSSRAKKNLENADDNFGKAANLVDNEHGHH
jgi:hypothetical protein